MEKRYEKRGGVRGGKGCVPPPTGNKPPRRVSGTLTIIAALVASLAVLGAYLVRAWADDLLPEGSLAPAFSLPNQDGVTVDSSELAGDWWLIYFYPKDDTPGCTKEACAFRDHLDRLTTMQVRIFGVSYDDVASHRAFADKYGLKFDLLADPKGRVIADWGARSAIPRVARRVSFLVDGSGTIRKVYPNVAPAEHALEIIADVIALRAG
ncbi:MAG: redoxin domain-containing protein [Nitrospirota bacterium]|nr:redoxin domain-containing protein [Nitrospirota bacterium]